MDRDEAWQALADSGHLDCEGWRRDTDGTVTCICGAPVSDVRGDCND